MQTRPRHTNASFASPQMTLMRSKDLGEVTLLWVAIAKLNLPTDRRWNSWRKFGGKIILMSPVR